MSKNILISAVSNNWVIGKNNNIPWYIPEDLNHFKEVTLNNTVIMGRKTFESINNKLLKNRLNIIIGNWNIDILKDACSGAIKIRSFTDLENLKNLKLLDNHGDFYYIGGNSIYKHVLKNNILDTMIITHIDVNVDIDDLTVLFPYKYINWSEWKINETKKITESAITITYTKKEQGI